MSNNKLSEAQAQLVQAQLELEQIRDQYTVINTELEETRRLAMMRSSAVLQDVSSDKLLEVARERATIRQTLNALNDALIEAQRRVRLAQERVNLLNVEIMRIKRDANIPEIQQRVSVMLPTLQALELELAAICELWVPPDTSNMPEVIPFVAGLYGHVRRLRPEIERATANAAKNTRKLWS